MEGNWCYIRANGEVDVDIVQSCHDFTPLQRISTIHEGRYGIGGGHEDNEESQEHEGGI